MAQTPSRRGLLGTALLAPLAAVPLVAAQASGDDAELIALAAEFDRLETAYEATMYNGPAGTAEEKAASAEQDRINAAQRKLAEQMARIPAVTLTGHAARARSLIGWAPDLMETCGDIETLLRSAILRDLTGIPAIPAPEFHYEPLPPVTPDPLVAMYAAYRESDHAAEIVSERADEIRRRLTARWGKPKQTAEAVWGHDPEYPEFCRLVDESDAHSENATDNLDKIMATPTTSVAGVIAKLQAAADIQEPASSETTYNEKFSLAAIQDAVRWLSSIGTETRT